MNKTVFVALSLLFAGLSVVRSLPASAAIGLQPISMALTARAPINSFTVTNAESVPKIVQVKVFAWEQKDGKDFLTESRDLIVSPPVFTVAADDRQVIRVGARNRNAPVERAYRIIFTETPASITARVAMAVEFHVSVPVFLEAATATNDKAVWSVRQTDARHVTVSVKNAASAHLHVLGLSLRDGSRALGVAKDVKYVLAGESRDWLIDVERPLGARSVSVDVVTDGGTAKLSLPVTP